MPGRGVRAPDFLQAQPFSSIFIKILMSQSQQARSFRSSAAVGHARRRFTPTMLVLALSSALALPGTAFAVDWVGGTSNDWFDGTNWNPNGAPAAGQTANIDSLGGQTTVIDAANGANAVAGNLFVGAAAGSTGGDLFIANGGLLSTADATVAGVANSAAFVTVDGAGTTGPTPIRWSSVLPEPARWPSSTGVWPTTVMPT
jgi:hypothetical protein